MMSLYEAIYNRKSTRNYSKKSLSKDMLQNIKNEISLTDKLFQDSEVSLQIRSGEEMEDFVSGLIGSYGKIEAPHYIIAFTSEDRKNLVNLGYVLEKIVLEITRLEVATCWMGSHFDEEELKEEFSTSKGMTPQVLVAFGEPGEGEVALREDPDEAKRKDLSEIILGEIGEVPKDWVEIIDAAKMAPSAMNSQPWRFEVGEGGTHLFIKSGEGIMNKLGETFGNLGEMNRIDAGIALRHVKIAANHFPKGIEFEKVKGMKMKNLSYIISAVDKE